MIKPHPEKPGGAFFVGLTVFGQSFHLSTTEVIYNTFKLDKSV